MGEEINRLLEAKFIREIKQATWLSPPVMVEKDTKIYRMCIDFTMLNKNCPKDYFPLPRIDQIINSTAGCERLSFLDAYSGYNQIRRVLLSASPNRSDHQFHRWLRASLISRRVLWVQSDKTKS
jgi:hypothetical protein